MTRLKRGKVKFGGIEIPELFVEKLHGKIAYYFKTENGNRVRRYDLEEAVRELNKYKQSKGEDLIPMKEHKAQQVWDLARETTPMDYEEGGRFYDPDDPKYEPEYYERVYALFTAIPKSFLIEQFRKMLEENPSLLAQETGVEELSYLPKLEPKKRYTLKQIGDFYLQREKYTPKQALRPKHLHEVKQYWDEFRKMVEVKTIGEIDKTILNKYNAELTKTAHDPGYRPSWLTQWQKKQMKGKILTNKWIKIRLDIVKTVLKNALNVVDYTADIENVLKLCRIVFHCDPLPKQIVKQISERKHIDAIFEVLNNPRNAKDRTANVRWKAMILMALNCAFTPVDFTDLEFVDINFETKELSMIRKKKNTERYAVLWNRTIEALNEYRKIRPNSKLFPNHIFVTRDGNLYNSDNCCNDFKLFMEKVNKLKENIIPAELTFKFFRKAAASSAERTPGANPSEVAYLMGHSSGIRAHYTHRAADLVSNVCRKIEQDYFG